MEIWKTIQGYPNYKASNLGRIKSFQKNKKNGRLMKPAPDANGYLRTMITNKVGNYTTVKVHRIIALTFIHNPENKPCINHVNGNKKDNSEANLEWCNISENIQHAYDCGIMSNVGQKNPVATLTDDQVIEIRKNYQYGRKSRHEGGKTKKQIAGEYNTTESVIKFIIQGKTWKHLL